MNKFLALKPKKVIELLKAAKPVMAIFSAINSLKKKITEKEKSIKNKKVAPEEIKELKIELKKKEKELEKMDEKKLVEGKKAIRFLLHYNQNFVKYLVRGYSSFGGKVDQEELTAEGISSLLKAIEKFDLNIKSNFSTYAGIWIKQYIQTYIKKSQFISQGSETEEKKNIFYYGSNYQSDDDKESRSHSLLETLHDDESTKLAVEQIRHQDATIQTNNLINSLENREAILLVRLLFKVKPSNLLDIYCLANEEEKKELKKKIKLSDKSSPELLQKYSWEKKSVYNLPWVKNYLSLFTKSHKFSEISKILKKSESITRRLKIESFKRLKKIAQGRNLQLLIDNSD